ncbi:MAG: hypothetical protein MI867_10615 [Pseudomonadales bacterium]|nr:hypothetical protein [Pseudomonadales bacterium]
MSDPYYDSVVKSIRQEATKSRDKASIFWDVVEGVSGIVDPIAGTSFGTGSTVTKTIINKATGKKTTPLVPNPWFVANGHEDGDTSYTKKYLKNRDYKKKGSTAIGLVGTATSQLTQVDVAGIIQHGNAVGSTSGHIYKLRSMAAGHKQSQTLTGWFDLLIKMKALKAGSRGTQLVGAAVPVGAVGLATDITKAALNMGIKLTMTKTCLATAADIHWRAYQEQAISGGLLGKSGKVGPASNMMYEIFARRGATRIFGKYDVDKIIKDPAGWLALNDKLMLI